MRTGLWGREVSKIQKVQKDSVFVGTHLSLVMFLWFRSIRSDTGVGRILVETSRIGVR